MLTQTYLDVTCEIHFDIVTQMQPWWCITMNTKAGQIHTTQASTTHDHRSCSNHPGGLYDAVTILRVLILLTWSLRVPKVWLVCSNHQHIRRHILGSQEWDKRWNRCMFESKLLRYTPPHLRYTLYSIHYTVYNIHLPTSDIHYTSYTSPLVFDLLFNIQLFGCGFYPSRLFGHILR